MHHEVNKALYDIYSLEDKGDFFTAYMYMKYVEPFTWHVYQSLGLPARDLLPEMDEGISEMLKIYVQEITDTSAARDTNIYHAKVLKLLDAIKLVTQKKDLELHPPERVMPWKKARDVILRNPNSIAVGTCACRSVAAKPCLPPPMEVCLFIGDPFASFIAEQNEKFRKISQDEAVKILEESHKRGEVHCAYCKKEMGNGFYAICNCCPCCCMGVRMWNIVGDQFPFLSSSGYVCEVSDDCNGCRICTEDKCPFNAISFDEDRERAIIDLAKCMGCGVCEDVCPTGALSLRREPSKGDPLDVEELKSQM